MIGVTAKTKHTLCQDPTVPVCLTSEGPATSLNHAYSPRSRASSIPHISVALLTLQVSYQLSLFHPPNRQESQWALYSPDEDVEVLGMTCRRSHGLLQPRMSSPAISPPLEKPLLPVFCAVFLAHSSLSSAAHLQGSHKSFKFFPDQ